MMSCDAYAPAHTTGMPATAASLALSVPVGTATTPFRVPAFSRAAISSSAKFTRVP